MAIDKNLLPSLRLIDSFLKMKKVHIEGISFMENRNVVYSKDGNKFVMDMDIEVNEYDAAKNARYGNLPEFSFTHNHRKYTVPKDMSRIAYLRDNILHNGINNFTITLDVYDIFTGKINPAKKYYFRYFIPIDRKVRFSSDFEMSYYTNQGKRAGELITVNLKKEVIHLYNLDYYHQSYLVVESSQKRNLKEIEHISYSTLLTLGFFTGTLHLNEAYSIASNRKNFNSPAGLYYKSLRKSITGQYNIFTTNAYSVLLPLARKMKVRDAESRMMKIIENKWGFKIMPIPERVFTKMVSVFCENDAISRAALILLTASHLGHELQSGVYCIAFETICNAIYKIYDLAAPHVIDTREWEKVRPELLKVFDNHTLSQGALRFGKGKIMNLNQPANIDKLKLSFDRVKYNLSEEEIKALNDRNRFMHGHLNVKAGENELNKLFFTSLQFHQFCCILILKMCEFDGYIINNLALYAPDLKIGLHQWGFKKI